MPRFHCPEPLHSGLSLDLPPSAARHVQVLRLQPGSAITLFNGEGGEYAAQVTQMGRSDVRVIVGAHDTVEREAIRAVHLLVGMPTNERMDWLVEKATELGVASITPLVTERTVLKLSGERAEKKRAHWQAIAVAACEQCGRNRVPMVHAVKAFGAGLAASTPQRWVLSLSPQAQSLQDSLMATALTSFTLLSGPEGGLSASEEIQALAQGYAALSLGRRILRAETAPLAALVALDLCYQINSCLSSIEKG